MKHNRIVFEISNYRCFSINSPVKFELENGITSLVGINNSGKSSLLKFFYETRFLFKNTSRANLIPLTNGTIRNPHEIRHEGNNSPYDLFSNKNNGNITIKVKIEYPTTESNLTYEGNRDNEGRSWLLSVERPEKFFIDHAIRGLDDINKVFYIGPFRNALGLGGGDDFDVTVGASFISRYNYWRAGASKISSKKIISIEEDIRTIFGFKSFSVSASDDKTNLQVNIDGDPYKLNELGSGLAQFILVFANVAMAEPSYILIDEPELNLHPSLQIDFLLSLSKYAKYGTILATHSMGLARSVSDRIYSVEKTEKGSIIRPIEKAVDYVQLLGELSYSAFRELGFDKVFLVEGVSEVKVMQQFLRLYGKEHKIVIIPLGGSQFINGNHSAELSEIKRISNNVSVLIDSERKNSNDPLSNERANFIEICKGLDFNIHVTERRATENYFTELAIQAAIHKDAKALEPYQLLKDAGKYAWSKSENWRIASHMKRVDLDSTDLGGFLEII